MSKLTFSLRFSSDEFHALMSMHTIMVCGYRIRSVLRRVILGYFGR